MLLIDAINIRTGGGLVLLKYLLTFLQQKEYENYVVIINEDVTHNFLNSSKVIIVNGKILSRGRLLEKYISTLKASKLLCFGNLPPTKRYKGVKVVTFCQNAHLFSSQGYANHNFKSKIRYWLLKSYFFLFKSNSDLYVVQTGYIKSLFDSAYRDLTDKCVVIPFYDDRELRKSLINHEISNTEGYIYVSNDAPHKNHIRLIRAWKLLFTKYGLNPTLKITIDEKSYLMKELELAQSEGINIVNLGNVSHSKVIEELKKTEYIIYPSLIETIGLGIVEGIECGNKLLVGDRPYVQYVALPSDTFDPFSIDSIADCILRSIKQDLPCSETLLKNKIEEFIKYIM